MKTYFTEPELTIVQFEAKDVLTISGVGGDDDELPPQG